MWQNSKVYNEVLSNQIEFWQFNCISEEKFFNQVDTGDILLFRCNNQRLLGSWLTRAFTNSHFDHIAIILRFGDSLRDLYVFEAVGDRGVRITSWISLRHEIYVNGFFDKICTRKLLFEMTPDRLNDLDQFRRNTVGHKYGLSPTRVIFTTKSQGNLNEERAQFEIEKDRQFFCSELVAKAFKVLGVLKDPDTKSSSNYYPGCFAPLNQGGGGTIDDQLKDNCAMGPVLNILVNAHNELNRNMPLQGPGAPAHFQSGMNRPRN